MTVFQKAVPEKSRIGFQSIGRQSSKEENLIGFDNSIAFKAGFVKGF